MPLPPTLPSTDHSIVCSYVPPRFAQTHILQLPALHRYASAHVRRAHEFAIANNRALYFISGFYGLIHCNEPVSSHHFDVLDTADFVTRTCNTILTHQIHDIWYVSPFDLDSDQSDRVMQKASARARMTALTSPLHVEAVQFYPYHIDTLPEVIADELSQ